MIVVAAAFVTVLFTAGAVGYENESQESLPEAGRSLAAPGARSVL